MQNNNNIWGVFWFGLIIGAALVFSLHHEKYQNKTAQEWYSEYEITNNLYNSLNATHANLIRCLSGITWSYDSSYLFSNLNKNSVDDCIFRYR